ncbi:MAG TPA: RNA polymerase sigma factor [Candidatus Paceibacterota bacterium]
MDNYEKWSDEDIIQKVRSSDRDLYVVIIKRFEGKLLRYAVNLIKDKDKAVDIVQESFIKAFINLRGFDIKKKFSSWIYRIVHNETINVLKRYRKEIPLLEDVDFKSSENLEEDFDKKAMVERVEKCFDKMPILYAEPLFLYYIEDKSYEDISDILRIPMGTVATRISRAKILMKKICLEI